MFIFYTNLEYNIASVTQNVFQKFKIVYKSNCNAKKYVYKDVFLYVMLQSMSTKICIFFHKIELKAITARKYKLIILTQETQTTLRRVD